MGAHSIKVGLTPLIIDLIQKKVISVIALNGAGAIHDVELALWGKTSEDVATNLQDGTFGMSAETAQFINSALIDAYKNSDMGYGECLGKKLDELNAENGKISILTEAYRNNIPVTIHIGIGTDIIYQHPNMDAAAAGELSYRDFKILSSILTNIGDGGIVMNIGSAVICPEVFLKALTVVKNLGYKADNFITSNFDMLQQYRPRVNIVQRPTQNSGIGYNFTGHHEIMIPLLFAMIKNEIKNNGK
jgi:deoxyhypusine synthase